MDNPVTITEDSAGNQLDATLLGLRFDKILIEDGSLYYRDTVLTEEGLELPFEKARLVVNQLSLSDNSPQTKPATVEGSFELRQPAELPAALFRCHGGRGPRESSAAGQCPDAFYRF